MTHFKPRKGKFYNGVTDVFLQQNKQKISILQHPTATGHIFVKPWMGR